MQSNFRRVIHAMANNRRRANKILKEQVKAEVMDRHNLTLDRYTINAWRLREKISFQQATTRACKSLRQAKRYGLMKPHNRAFVERWFYWQPTNDSKSIGESRRGGSKGNTMEFKEQIVHEFLRKNERDKISLRQFCSEHPDSRVNKSNLSRWMIKDDIHAFPYNGVPAQLRDVHTYMRLQYAARNLQRDWYLTSCSDEGFMDISENYATLKGKAFHFCRKEERYNAPDMWDTKWSGNRIPFTVIVSFQGINKLVTWQNDAWSEEPKPEPIISMRAIDKVSVQEMKQDLPDNQSMKEFQKRGWKQPQRKRKKKDKNTPKKAAFTTTKENYCQIVAPHILEWYQAMQQKCLEKRARYTLEGNAEKVARWNSRNIMHFHDNAAYYTANFTQDWFKRRDVPIYPPGHFYGFHYGFPPYSPDFNCPAEYTIGHLKYLVAKRMLVEGIDGRLITPQQLVKIMHEEFNTIPRSQIRNYYRRMKKLMNESLMKGGHYGPSVKNLRTKKELREQDMT